MRCKLAFIRVLAVAAALFGGQSVARASVRGVSTVTARLAAATPSEHEAAGDSASTQSEAEATPPQRRWIRHEVVFGERFEDIAERYCVHEAALIRWNKKRLGPKNRLYAGRTLKVYAKCFPPPRERVNYEVQFGDTWGEIADRFNVQVSDLRAWNPKVPKRFRAGVELVVWTNPIESQPAGIPEEEGGEPLPQFTVRPGGLSVGKPNRGRLINGVRLPDSDLYTIRDPDKVYGTSHAVLLVQNAMAAFRRESGFEGEILVGAISRQGGGRFRPHKSHQSGRDIDIRLPKKPGADRRSESIRAIDWRSAWIMIKSFVDTGEIEYIFLEYGRQRALYQAARGMGVSREELAKVIQYPRPARSNNGIVRHARGHTVHIHIRVTCSKGNGRCESY